MHYLDTRPDSKPPYNRRGKAASEKGSPTSILAGAPFGRREELDGALFRRSRPVSRVPGTAELL
jgi:hypothetical protein